MAGRRITAVRLRNNGDTLFSQKYDGERYEIPPGVDMIVPYDAMVLWLGNPELVDIDRRRRFRTNEFARLCVKYGVYDQVVVRSNQFPKMEVYTLTDNTRISTVLDDPEGKLITPEIQTAATNARQLEQMELMRAQMEQMQAEMALLLQGRGTGVTLEPDDTRVEQPESRPEIVKPDISDIVESQIGGAVPDQPRTPRNGPRKVTANV